MNNDHWPVYDQATAEPKYGYNPFAWSAEAADDWPIPYTLTPAAEALLEAEAGDGTVHTVEAHFGDPANGQVIITSKPAPDADAEPDHQAEAG